MFQTSSNSMYATSPSKVNVVRVPEAKTMHSAVEKPDTPCVDEQPKW